MTRRRRGLCRLTLLATLALVGCNDDGGPATTTSSDSTSSTIAPDDPTLEPLLLTAADLPEGFTPTEDVADTVTTFCAGQDATAGMSGGGPRHRRVHRGRQRAPR